MRSCGSKAVEKSKQQVGEEGLFYESLRRKEGGW